MKLDEIEPLPCPFCDGHDPELNSELRAGYMATQSDPDAYAFWYRCNSCGAQGGWAKSETGALRYWNMRHLNVPLVKPK